MRPVVKHSMAALTSIDVGGEVVDVDESGNATKFKCVPYDPFAFTCCRIGEGEIIDVTWTESTGEDLSKKVGYEGQIRICDQCGRWWMKKSRGWATLVPK